MLNLTSPGAMSVSLWFIAGVAALTGVVSLICQVRRARRDRAREVEFLRLAAELRVFADASLSIGARVARVERAAPVASPGPVPAPVPLRQTEQTNRNALDMAERGAGVDDLVAACDLSRSEAGLVIALQRRGRKLLSVA